MVIPNEVPSGVRDLLFLFREGTPSVRAQWEGGGSLVALSLGGRSFSSDMIAWLFAGFSPRGLCSALVAEILTIMLYT